MILLTDGLVEWKNREGKQFGEKALMGFIQKNKTGDIDQLLTQLLQQVQSFSEGIPCHDDLTLIGFQVL